jgi:hypothetical protein
MAMTRQGDRRKDARRRGGRRKGDIEKIIIGGEKDTKQEVTVRHEGVVPQQKPSSVWSWHEEFSIEWSETFLIKK